MNKADPHLVLLVDALGYDTYEKAWKDLSFFTRLNMTLRGWAPGGRKGAPALRTSTGRNA